MMERPYYMDYSPARLVIHKMVTSKYFDLAISAVIGLNVITMAMEFYMMPEVNIFNFFATISKHAIMCSKLKIFIGFGVCFENIQLLFYWNIHH